MDDKQAADQYSQGICEDGVAILKNGVQMTVEEILEALRAQGEAVAWANVDANGEHTYHGLRELTKGMHHLYTHPAPVRAVEWQPRETAPRDGSVFHTYNYANDERLYSMYWDGEEFITEYESWCGEFSHWTPLPEPPKETQG